MASLRARHSRKCSLRGAETKIPESGEIDGCTCLPTFSIRHHKGGNEYLTKRLEAPANRHHKKALAELARFEDECAGVLSEGIDCALCRGLDGSISRQVSAPVTLCGDHARQLVNDALDGLDITRRLDLGCRMCGSQGRESGYASQVPFSNHTTGRVLVDGPGALCSLCLKAAFDFTVAEFPMWITNNLQGALEDRDREILTLKREVERQKKLRRNRDAKRKEQRREKDQGKKTPTIAERIVGRDWGMLRVIFSEDTAGTKLINLIAHPATPEEERRTAITKLEGRRIRWQQTTSSETQNMRPATKSALSLESSRGE